MDWIASIAFASEKMVSVWFRLIVALTIISLGDGAFAANIRVVPATAALEEKLGYGEIDAVIDFSGPIEPGDADRLREVVAELKPESFVTGASGFEGVVRLNSRGGTFKEAIVITKILKAHKMQTFVAKDAECLSACAVIFMAGTYQAGFRQQEVKWRKVEWPVKLGFHRPSIQELAIDIRPELLKEMDSEAIEFTFNNEYRRAFDVANQLIQEMLGVDPAAWRPELLVRMLTATKQSAEGEFVYLETVDDALIWDIDVINAVPPAGNARKERYVENFWLCYNAGRAIPAYAGIWPDIATAEETLAGFLPECCGKPGLLWDSKMIEDDNLTYYTRVRGWVFGCTIRYENIGDAPKITFVHDDAVVTQTELLQRYNPGLALNKVVTQQPPRQSVRNDCGSGFDTRDESDAFGNDIGGYRASVSECRRRCLNHPSCVAFSWIKPQKKVDRRCWLKSRVSGPSHKAGVLTCLRM